LWSTGAIAFWAVLALWGFLLLDFLKAVFCAYHQVLKRGSPITSFSP